MDGRKLSEKIAPFFKKISIVPALNVVEPSLDPKLFNVNGTAFLLNLLMLYGFAAGAFILSSLFGVAHRGFFCDDDSIRYEYRPDTVTTIQLVVYNLILNAIIVVFVEYYRMRKIEANIINPKYRWQNNHIHVLFVRLITYFGYSQIGFVMNYTLNLATKHVVGRLRPHFIDVCKLANGTCTSENMHKYIIDYTCNGNAEQVLEARKSFYSGHSAISMYCAVWTALYLQARMSKVLVNRILVPIIQTFVITIGLLICFSRITDNKHHWSDVLVGILVGTFLAVYTCVFWTEIFKNDEFESEIAPILSSVPIDSRNQAIGNLQSSSNQEGDTNNAQNRML